MTAYFGDRWVQSQRFEECGIQIWHRAHIFERHRSLRVDGTEDRQYLIPAAADDVGMGRELVESASEATSSLDRGHRSDVPIQPAESLSSGVATGEKKR